MIHRIYKDSKKLQDAALQMYEKRKDDLSKRIEELEGLKSDSSKKIYKNRTSWQNQRNGVKCHTMCVSKRKDEGKYKFSTDQYKGKVLEMYQDAANEGFAYVAAGRNSLVRNLLVADIDSDQYSTEALLEMAKSNRLQPSYIRTHKTTGHKQIGFFIEEIQVKHQFWKNSQDKPILYIVEDKSGHEAYTLAYRLLNMLAFPGDPGYTGYNCQNPFYEDQEWETEWFGKSFQNCRDILEKLEKVLETKSGLPISGMQPSERKAFFRQWTVARKKAEKFSEENPLGSIVFLDKVEAELESLGERLERTQGMINARLRKLSANGSLYDNSFDKQYFVVCTQVANRWRKLGRLSEANIWAMANEAKQNMELLGPTGYTSEEAWDRIVHDMRQLLEDAESESPSVDWSSVGYTPIQRALSLQVRRCSKVLKIKAALSAISKISEGDWARLPLRSLAELAYRKMPRQGMSKRTLFNFISALRPALSDTNISHKDISKIEASLDFQNSTYSGFWDHKLFLEEFKRKLASFKFRKVCSNLHKKFQAIPNAERNAMEAICMATKSKMIYDDNNKRDRQDGRHAVLEAFSAYVGLENWKVVGRHKHFGVAKTKSLPDRMIA